MRRRLPAGRLITPLALVAGLVLGVPLVECRLAGDRQAVPATGTPAAANAAAAATGTARMSALAGSATATAATAAAATATAAAPVAPAPPAPDRLYVYEGAGTPNQRLLVLDAATGTPERELPLGAPARDWSRLYAVERLNGQSMLRTTVRAVDPTTGAAVWEATLEGDYTLPLSNGVTPGGLSPNGRWLALQGIVGAEQMRTFQRERRWQSRFVVLDTTGERAPQHVELEGSFWVFAVGDDGATVYLAESLPPLSPTEQQIRVYDLAREALEPSPVVDQSGAASFWGARVAGLLSPDGRRHYGLYVSTTEAPFVHALDLAGRTAARIPLPGARRTGGEEDLLWTLASSRDGATLYAVNAALANAALASVFELDAARLEVRRAAELSLRAARPPGLLAALARWLVPAAEAKRLLIGGAALSPDGSTLYALGEQGLIAVDTRTLSVRGRYLEGWTLDSLALSPGGERLYAVSLDRLKLLRVDPETGALLGEVAGLSRPWGVLRVEATR